MTVINTTPGATRFRRSGGVWMAAMLALVFVMPFAGSVFVELESTRRLVLAPIATIAILIPLAVTVWALRSGVDVNPEGITVKALLGSRSLAWSDLAGFDHHDGKVYATLNSGSRLELPSIRPVDLPRLVAAGGNRLIPAEPEPEPESESESADQ